MAVKPAARSAANTEETSEREYQETLNRAVEDTEGEIFADALGEEELDNDGDTSLEDMGEGLEGEEVEDDLEAEEGDEERAEGEEAEGEEEGDEEVAEGEEGEEESPRDQRGRFQQDDRRVPPGRLREEANARRAAETEAAQLRQQLAEMNGRLTEISARVNAPPQRQQQREPQAPPDMFAEPEKHQQWMLEEAERRAEAKFNQYFQSYEQRQQANSAQQVDAVLAEESRGPRSFEFTAAYNALTSLNPRDPQVRATVGRIYKAAERGDTRPLWDWWEDNGGSEYRERVAEQLQQLAPRQRDPRQRGGERVARGEVRHVIRQGQRLPSLNSATGSNNQRVADPEMFDGSEESVFRHATRR
jgi:hypothetical protein